MNTTADHVVDLIFGRWRSQVLYAGAELGVFDHLERGEAKTVETIATELDVSPALLYRLLRALASLGLPVENGSHHFSISEAGELLRVDHPRSLKHIAVLTEGPEHYALWRHLPQMIRDGEQNAFIREFGAMAFEYARRSERYGRVFNQAMTSYSVMENALVLEALQDYDFSSVRTLCDVGGGHGHLVCAFLKAYPHLSGLVLELPEVVSDPSRLWATKLGLEARCTYVPGDMFKRVPTADAYVLKRILHDWNDAECVEVLSNMRTSASDKGRAFIIEQVVPGPDTPHFSKLYDIHMMCWGTGRERTEDEYARLLAAAGWKCAGSYYPSNRMIGVIEGVGV
jgi:hypothetical protein